MYYKDRNGDIKPITNEWQYHLAARQCERALKNGTAVWLPQAEREARMRASEGQE